MTSARILERTSFDALFAALTDRGYRCVGPTVRDGAIVYGELGSSADLPEGWTDVQDAGHYRLKRRSDAALFGYVVGPQSWKQFVQPPRQRLWTLRRRGRGFELAEGEERPPRYAFLGVRACELAALQVQDRVFSSEREDRFADAYYQEAREQALIIAVSCTQSASTCFCTSVGTGPAVKEGEDLRLTEVVGSEHHFVVEAGTARGEEILAALPTRVATDAEVATAHASVESAADQQRRLSTDGLPELLRRNRESVQWQQIAERCLACANCTMVCPTCFCSDIEDVSDLTGEHAERWRSWDSCFNPGFSYLSGGEVRRTTASRYRQWMTHKLSSWVDQFGTSGCVGCGRCITWCPVGIDLTEEVAEMRRREAT